MRNKRNAKKNRKRVESEKINTNVDIEKNAVKNSENKDNQRIKQKHMSDKKVKKRPKDKVPLTEAQRAKKKKKRIICLIFILIILVILLTRFLVSLYKWNKIMKDVIHVENSIVVDSTGNIIAVLGESRIQKSVSLNNIPQNLINAYVSIEDKNFYKHHGINLKRTIGAVGSYVVNRGSASYGGSTITQQLVKNVTGENESSISRKVVEWDRALKTEMVLSKDEIMQTYLNIIYVGPNVYGVEMGSRYYFNKGVSDLDLAECAFLAGLNHSPNSYNPFGETDNSERIKTRATTVLGVMLEENYITDEEYGKAIEELEDGLNFDEGDVEPKGDSIYSYMVDATISEVISDLEEEKKMSTSFATNYLYFSGLRIYSTQNSDIQEDIDNECSKGKYMIKSTKTQGATSQAAMVVMDHKTGQVVGCVRWFG